VGQRTRMLRGARACLQDLIALGREDLAPELAHLDAVGRQPPSPNAGLRTVCNEPPATSPSRHTAAVMCQAGSLGPEGSERRDTASCRWELKGAPAASIAGAQGVTRRCPGGRTHTRAAGQNPGLGRPAP
jgi:hypothetical protein